jgi:hypothetical protein
MGVSLSHSRYEEIKRIVVDLFIKFDVRCVPISGFELATKMGRISSMPENTLPTLKPIAMQKTALKCMALGKGFVSL